MKTFHLSFEVAPTPNNEQYQLVKGATVHCWVVERDPQTAYAQAAFFVSKYDWKIERNDTLPVEVKEENFLERDLGLEQYRKAQEEGISIAYVGWSRDGKTASGPFTLKLPYRFNMAEFLKKQKELRNRGRCLHYDSGEKCNHAIKAHSIQKNQSLAKIAHDGKVYTLSSNMSDIKKNRGNPSYEKIGINKVSTFLGFCKRHDNELFEPIDNNPLCPTEEQVFLYSYRSMCRELFVKENAVDHLNDQLNSSSYKENEIGKFLSVFRDSFQFGLNNLRRHKSLYDADIRTKKFDEIKYVLFVSLEKPFLAFSGLLYPDFDFMGRQLQYLGDHKNSPDLITFCSAPMESGWGFLFAWHKSSSDVCSEFMMSLATMIHEGKNLGDLLFRLVISGCENLAISPKWWDRLSQNNKEQILSYARLNANIFTAIKPTYLMEGLEGIAQWEFESVISEME